MMNEPRLCVALLDKTGADNAVAVKSDSGHTYLFAWDSGRGEEAQKAINISERFYGLPFEDAEKIRNLISSAKSCS